jgi:hypothetical protein
MALDFDNTELEPISCSFREERRRVLGNKNGSVSSKLALAAASGGSAGRPRISVIRNWGVER